MVIVAQLGDFMIVKCSHCKEMFDNQSFEEHKCDIPLSGVKKIEVVYFHDGSYGKKKLLTALGIDGILYSFEVIPRKGIPYFMRLSDGRKHLDKSNGKVPVPSTVKRIIMSYLKKFRERNQQPRFRLSQIFGFGIRRHVEHMNTSQ